MTTVAVDVHNRIIATDSRVSGGGIRQSTIKVHETPDGTLIAFCGDLYPARAFIEWIEGGGRREDAPKFDDGQFFEAVSVERDGVYSWDTMCYKSPVVDDAYFTMGSGCQWAMSALMFGASLEEAVEFACEMDDSSGGAVRTYVFQDKGSVKSVPSVRKPVRSRVAKPGKA